MKKPAGPGVRVLSRTLKFLAFFLVLEYLIFPQVAGARHAASLLSNINLAFAGAGILLEAAALIAYAQLTRAVLPSDAPGLFTILRIDLSTLALSHVVPGGTAAGAPLAFRLLTQAGVAGTDAGFAMATQGIGSAVVLNLLLWLGLVISIPLRGVNPLYAIGAILGVIVVGGFAGLVLLLTWGEVHAAKIVRWVARRLPLLDEEAAHRLVHRLAARLKVLGRDRKVLYRAVGWATANWLLDAASLWVFLAAFGARLSVDGLLVAYGLANVLAAIPITPGGLGVVEGVLTPTLVGFGITRGIAILGVISWRLVNFWLPIPVGGAAYISLRARPGQSMKQKTKEIAAVAKQTLAVAEDREHWAERHGMKLGKPSGSTHAEEKPVDGTG
ncbi:MAG: YbhN family protein [Actinomycetota bacterium]|nr:flippase-like domain-containing protein [Actinomycetota bacterium]